MTPSAWPARRWLAAVGGAVLTALVVGVPTGIVETPFYTRMTPVLWWNYPVWIATALLGGLIIATYVRTPETRQAMTGASAGGGLLSVLAVGCPVCNKLVVALLAGVALGAIGPAPFDSPVEGKERGRLRQAACRAGGKT